MPALLDTGASYSTFPEGYVHKFNPVLKEIGKQKVFLWDKEVERKTYDVQFTDFVAPSPAGNAAAHPPPRTGHFCITNTPKIQ